MDNYKQLYKVSLFEVTIYGWNGDNPISNWLFLIGVWEICHKNKVVLEDITIVASYVCVHRVQLGAGVGAVYEVGVMMKSIWKKDGRFNMHDLETVIDTKYFKHPADVNWMEKLIVDWKNNNPDALTRARYRSEAAYKLALGKDALDKFLHDAHNLREDLKRKQKQIDDASKN